MSSTARSTAQRGPKQRGVDAVRRRVGAGQHGVARIAHTARAARAAHHDLKRCLAVLQAVVHERGEDAVRLAGAHEQGGRHRVTGGDVRPQRPEMDEVLVHPEQPVRGVAGADCVERLPEGVRDVVAVRVEIEIARRRDVDVAVRHRNTTLARRLNLPPRQLPAAQGGARQLRLARAPFRIMVTAHACKACQPRPPGWPRQSLRSM